MARDLYTDTTPTTTSDPPTRAEVAGVHGEDEARRLFQKDELASRLYATPPAAPAWGLSYGLESDIGPDVTRNIEKRVARERLSAEDMVRERREYFGMLERLGLDQDAKFALALHDKLTAAKLTAERPGVDPATLEVEAQRQSEDTFTRLRERWGKEFDPLFDRVTRYVAADAELSAALASGPGNDFDVATEIFEHVQRHNLGR